MIYLLHVADILWWLLLFDKSSNSHYWAIATLRFVRSRGVLVVAVPGH